MTKFNLNNLIFILNSENEIKTENVEQAPTLSLFTFLNFRKTKSSLTGIKSQNLPSFKGLIAILLIYAAATILLTFISFLSSDVTMLLFAAAVASMMFPLFSILSAFILP